MLRAGFFTVRNICWPAGYYHTFSENNNQVLSSEIDKMSLVMRNTAFCICENKDADELRGNREADQRLWFRYIAGTIPLLLKYKIPSF